MIYSAPLEEALHRLSKFLGCCLFVAHVEYNITHLGLLFILVWSNVTHMGTNKREITPYSMALAKAIESYGAEAGIKNPALAEKSGVPLSTLRKILKLQSVADFEQMRKLADALGIKLSDLVSRAESIAARTGLEDKESDIH